MVTLGTLGRRCVVLDGSSSTKKGVGARRPIVGSLGKPCSAQNLVLMVLDISLFTTA